MQTKRYWGKSITSVVAWIMVLFPYLIIIPALSLRVDALLFVTLGAVVVSYVFYVIAGIFGIGHVSIGERVRCQRDWAPPFYYIQGKLDFAVKDITVIEFGHLEGNSDGIPMYRMWDLSYLFFYLSDGSTKVLYLGRYSPRQYIQIQKRLLDINPSIEVLYSAEDFIKKFHR